MSDTYNENPNRFDSSPAFSGVYFSAAATPLVPKGSLVYNNGSLRLNVGSSTVPVWRTVTNS